MRNMNHNSKQNQQWRRNNKRHMRGVSDVIMKFDRVS
jgi:hypothetical protein